MIIEIPIISSVAQQSVVQLIDTKYRLDFKYNERSEIWTIGISNEASKDILIQGLPLVLGQELLEPYNFNIGRMFVIDNRNRGEEADFEGFEDTHSLVWISADEVLP
jgi:hypothetical protein